MLLGKFDGTWNKGVLRRAVDERNFVKNTSDSKHSGWGDFFVASLDSVEEVISSVIDTFDNVGVTLGIRCPENYDLVEVVGNLELTKKLISVLPRC
jgi:L-alanine-DL-glutamate epimerase-like enolase superfamily enzyme